jgi:hypothetical protein
LYVFSVIPYGIAQYLIVKGDAESVWEVLNGEQGILNVEVKNGASLQCITCISGGRDF